MPSSAPASLGWRVRSGLSQQGLRVALIGPRVLPHVASPAAPYDARIYAVAPATVELLQRLSVWNRIDTTRATPVERMRVFGDRGDELTFDAYAATVERLATIRRGKRAGPCAGCRLRFPAGHRACCRGLSMRSPRIAEAAAVGLSDGASLHSRLLVGADGAQSAVRAAAGMNATVTDYRQTAVVSNFACERPHLNTAWQWFTDEGVVALLPLPGEQVSLVWSAPTVLSQELAALDAVALARRVTERCGAALGELARRRPGAYFPAAADRCRPVDRAARCTGRRCGPCRASTGRAGPEPRPAGRRPHCSKWCAAARLFGTLATRSCCDDTSAVAPSRLP